MEILVRAMPAPGHTYRRRIGRAFGKEPVKLRVVDSPKEPDEISPADYDRLLDDPHINALPVGGDATDADIVRLKTELAQVRAELDKARKELADAIEAAEAERSQWRGDAEKAAERSREIEAELEDLRAQLAKRRKG